MAVLVFVYPSSYHQSPSIKSTAHYELALRNYTKAPAPRRSTASPPWSQIALVPLEQSRSWVQILIEIEVLQFNQVMPKVVDNFVLERKIGSGQFGDVFKGYNKNSRQDVAIKTIKRQSLKGKFSELLQNEIKVLKMCDNVNIIKLYDLKKTANNFYLMLEYCNQGDLMAELKREKFLTEEKAVEYLNQIINAFKTLVKNKIMHRDFKLANILKHDGKIKVADFGFAKMLSQEDFTTTMLGSPLNMAPQVLGGNEYNNKADIWSIGTVFYEMLFGKTPYTASNMVDLIANIKNKPLVFPKSINNVSPIVEDVLRKMIVVDPAKRIEWEDLFKHPINHYLQDKLKKEMEETLHQGEDVSLNMSKFYIKANIVVDHPDEIAKKEQINNYAIDVVKGKADTGFKGDMIKRDNLRKQETEETNYDKKSSEIKDIKDESDGKLTDKQTERELKIKSFKSNAYRLLHYRNIYVFLASVAEEAMNQMSIKSSEIVCYLLVRKLLDLIQWMKQSMDGKKPLAEMQYWEQFTKQKDYTDIKQYIEKEYDVFNLFYQSIFTKLKENSGLKQQNPEVYDSLFQKDIQTDKLLSKVLHEYAKSLMSILLEEMEKQKSVDPFRKKWIHIDRILDCMNLDKVFQFQKNGIFFNFRQYYASNDTLTSNELLEKVTEKFKHLK